MVDQRVHAKIRFLLWFHRRYNKNKYAHNISIKHKIHLDFCEHITSKTSTIHNTFQRNTKGAKSSSMKIQHNRVTQGVTFF
jgi:hypothetical protein